MQTDCSSLTRRHIYVELRNDPSAIIFGENDTLVKMTREGKFRSWVVVKHKPTGCIKKLHHVDWELEYRAEGIGGDLTLLLKRIKATVPNGDGSPGLIIGRPFSESERFLSH